MGNKYLSEVIEEHKQEILGDNSLILITSGVGSGKNTWVQKNLTKELKENESILFITSRKMIRQQMAQDKRFVNDLYVAIRDKKNLAISHHSLGEFLRDENNLGKLEKLNFKYIVVDEVHSILADSTYTNTSFYLFSLINYYNALGTKKIICMSATTTDIKEFLQYTDNFKSFNFTEECINVKPLSIKIIEKKYAKFELSTAYENNKMIYMGNSATDIITKLAPNLINQQKIEAESIGIITSDYKSNSLKSKSDKNVKPILENMNNLTKSIIETEKLPDNINILLSTSKIKEGININDDRIKCMFCESHDATDIIQFAGRYRGSVETLYIIYDSQDYYSINDISELDYEENYLFQYELNNINVYYSLIQFKITGEINNYLSINNNYERYQYILPSIYAEPFSLKEYKDYIEAKYSLVRFNSILNKFDKYTLRYYQIHQMYENSKSFYKNPVEYLKEITKVEDVKIDICIERLSEDIKEHNREYMLDYLRRMYYVNVPILKHTQQTIFEVLTIGEYIPELHKFIDTELVLGKTYTSLGRLLSAYNIKSKRIGANKDNTIMIIDEEDYNKQHIK